MTSPLPITLREAEDADLPALLAIYTHHVRHGFGTFEETPPTPEEMRARWEAVRAKNLPYLVAFSQEAPRDLAGFAYAGPFRPRSAYRFTVEDSVYIAPGLEGRGVGRALLGDLVRRCEALGYRKMVAVVGDSGNHASITMHQRCGFEIAGVLTAAGFKHGRWVDSVLMHRFLGQGNDALP